MMVFFLSGMHEDAPTTDDKFKDKPIKRDPSDSHELCLSV
jgi:hypothetical protein